MSRMNEARLISAGRIAWGSFDWYDFVSSRQAMWLRSFCGKGVSCPACVGI